MKKTVVKFHFSTVHQFYNVRSLDKRCNIWNALVVSSATFGNEKFLFTQILLGSQEIIYKYYRWHDFNYVDLYYKDAPCLNRPYHDISNCCTVSKGRLQFLEHFEGNLSVQATQVVSSVDIYCYVILMIDISGINVRVDNTRIVWTF